MLATDATELRQQETRRRGAESPMPDQNDDGSGTGSDEVLKALGADVTIDYTDQDFVAETKAAAMAALARVGVADLLIDAYEATNGRRFGGVEAAADRRDLVPGVVGRRKLDRQDVQGATSAVASLGVQTGVDRWGVRGGRSPVDRERRQWQSGRRSDSDGECGDHSEHDRRSQKP